VEENRTAVLTAVDIPQIEKLRFTGNVSLDKVHGQYYPSNTRYNPICVFNCLVLEQRTGYASTGRFFNFAVNIGFPLVWSAIPKKLRTFRLARSPAPSGRGC
jgi:hypothetical protein